MEMFIHHEGRYMKHNARETEIYTGYRKQSVHRTSSCFGVRTFAGAATRVWNSLTADSRGLTKGRVVILPQAVAERKGKEVGLV